MTIENIISDIESKTILDGDQYVCDWFGKEFHGKTKEEVQTKIIEKYNLGSMPKNNSKIAKSLLASGMPRRNTWRNR